MFLLLVMIYCKLENFYHMYDIIFYWFSFLSKWKAGLVALARVSKINGWWLTLPHHSPLARITVFFLVRPVSFQPETMVITRMESCKKTWSDFILIFSILPLLMNQNCGKKLLVRRSTFFPLFSLWAIEMNVWRRFLTHYTTCIYHHSCGVCCSKEGS